jgi:hypothetical protein
MNDTQKLEKLANDIKRALSGFADGVEFTIRPGREYSARGMTVSDDGDLVLETRTKNADTTLTVKATSESTEAATTLNLEAGTINMTADNPIAVADVAVSNDLTVGNDATVSGDLSVVGTTTVSAPLNMETDWQIDSDGNILYLRRLDAGKTAFLLMHPKDGDNTDDCQLLLYGTFEATLTNYERLRLGFENSLTEYVVHSAAGGTGTVRPLRIYTGTNSTQLLLAVDGTTSAGGTFTAKDGLIVQSNTAAAITAERVLAAADSGGVFSIAQTSTYGITLPAPAQGLSYKFVLVAAGAFTVTITATGAYLYGIHHVDGASVSINATTSIVFVSGTAVVGDIVELYGVDSTHWMARIHISATGGVTTS